MQPPGLLGGAARAVVMCGGRCGGIRGALAQGQPYRPCRAAAGTACSAGGQARAGQGWWSGVGALCAWGRVIQRAGGGQGGAVMATLLPALDGGQGGVGCLSVCVCVCVWLAGDSGVLCQSTQLPAMYFHVIGAPPAAANAAAVCHAACARVPAGASAATCMHSYHQRHRGRGWCGARLVSLPDRASCTLPWTGGAVPIQLC
jgi:hypothetical protein